MKIQNNMTLSEQVKKNIEKQRERLEAEKPILKHWSIINKIAWKKEIKKECPKCGSKNGLFRCSFGALNCADCMQHIEEPDSQEEQSNQVVMNLAQKFHRYYEELAPEYGYETKEETRRFDKNSPNGKLMIAVCERILADLVI